MYYISASGIPWSHAIYIFQLKWGNCEITFYGTLKLLWRVLLMFWNMSNQVEMTGSSHFLNKRVWCGMFCSKCFFISFLKKQKFFKITRQTFFFRSIGITQKIYVDFYWECTHNFIFIYEWIYWIIFLLFYYPFFI